MAKKKKRGVRVFQTENVSWVDFRPVGPSVKRRRRCAVIGWPAAPDLARRQGSEDRYAAPGKGSETAQSLCSRSRRFPTGRPMLDRIN